MSTRAEILESVVDTLAGIVGITEVRHGPPGIAGLENPVLPVVAVWWTEDAHAPTSKVLTSNQLLNLTVTVIDADQATSEAWTRPIKAAIDAAPTLGGLAQSIKLQTETPGYVRPVFERLGIDINYKVTYRDA